MMQTNLIPRHRLTERRSNHHAQWWLVGGAIYAAALALAGVVMAGSSYVGGNIDQAIADAAATTEQNKLEQASLDADLSGAQAELHAMRFVTERPDWSILLAEISTLRGDDVVLHSLQLAPATHSVTPSHNTPYTVSLSGHGRSQAAVSAFTLRLEQNGLFRSVKVLTTRREPYAGGTAIRFELACHIGPEEPSR